MVILITSYPAKPLLKSCRNCNIKFETIYKDKIYCSISCKGKYKYKKNIINYRKKYLDYFYKNRDEILKKQIIYKMKRYKEDKIFHVKDNIRKIATHNISLKDKVCLICGTNKDLQRHHEDYNKPLEVKILCRKHHNYIHFNEEK